MHEMSLAVAVLEIVEEAARKNGATRVKSVRLEVGRLAALEPQALRFCFDAVTRGSIADGCALEIVQVPGRGWCLQCSDSVELEAPYSACPRCGSCQVQVTEGTEMRVMDLLVD